MIRIVIISFLALCAASCTRVSSEIEPLVHIPKHPKAVCKEKGISCELPTNFSVSPFAPLSLEEEGQEWGKELKIGYCFAQDFDLYRAITAFKRSLYLLPVEKVGRRLEIEYAIMLAYYLGEKYQDALTTIRDSGLAALDASFPAYQDFLLIVYDCFHRTGCEEQAQHILTQIESKSPSIGKKLGKLSLLETGKLLASNKDELTESSFSNLALGYQSRTKSPFKAQLFNALLPGAGYFYVGQKETAVTAFLVNTLFIGAAAHFFERGNLGAGLLTLSLESGWYFGGIYGGGLAAKAYNERLYESYADKMLQKEPLHPMMMLRFTF